MNLLDAIVVTELNLPPRGLLAILLVSNAAKASHLRRQLRLKEYLQILDVSLERSALGLCFDSYGRESDSLEISPSNYIKPRYKEKLRNLLLERLQIGHFMICLGMSRGYQETSLGAALELARIVHTNSQFKTYIDSSGSPAGAVTWAWIEESCACAALASGDMHLHPSEWDAGRILWFRDIAVTTQSAFAISRDIGGDLFPSETYFLVTMRSRRSGQTVAVKFSAAERASLHDWVVRQARLSASRGECRGC
jgi:hemolysin-activating ACP:hemolysin acyltransferase